MASPCQVHNVRFYDLPPRSAHCLAYSRSRNLLALSRADNSIEVWHLGYGNDKQRNNKISVAPVMQRIIPANETQGSVEALVWAGGGNKTNNCIDDQINTDKDGEEYDSDDSSIAPTNPTKNPKSSTNVHKKLNLHCSVSVNDNRLFSTGLHGLLIEHDLDTLDQIQNDNNLYIQEKQNVWSVTSGAAWCMRFNARANRLAIGTEEGYVSLFRVGGINGLDFDKVLDKQEGRILCLDWHSDGRHIVTGSPDTIRLWDVVTGHPLTRMSTGRTEKHRETTVWSLIILDDFTVISGDSRGKTSFWNGRTGTLTDAYQTHIADVLTVATNDSQSIVYSSGVDPSIMQFQPISTNLLGVNKGQNPSKTKVNGVHHANGEINRTLQKRPKWVKTSHRSANTHDVRAIVCVGKKVCSVGVDADLCINDTISRTLAKHPPIPHNGNVVIAKPSTSGNENPKVALKYENKIEIWNLGKSININPSADQMPPNSSWTNTYMPLQEDAEKLLTLVTKDNMPIASFDMASDASALVYVTTDSCVRIFEINFDIKKENQTSAPKISRVSFRNNTSSDEDNSEAVQGQLSLSRYSIAKFIPTIDKDTSLKLLLATIGGTLQCYELPIGEQREQTSTKLLWSVSPREHLGINSGISQLAVHPRGTACAIADFEGNVRIINLKNIYQAMIENSFSRAEIARSCIKKVATYTLAVVSCMAFSPKIEGNLVIVYSNHHFVEVDSTSGKYTEFTNKITNTGKKYRQLPTEWTEKKFATKGIAFVNSDRVNKKSNEAWMFYDEVNICTFDKQIWSSNLSIPNSSKIEKVAESDPAITKSVKRKKGDNVTSDNKIEPPASMRVTKKYEYLVHLGILNSLSEPHMENNFTKIESTRETPSTQPSLVAVEVKPQFLESQLPPSVRQKKFGAM